MADLGPSAPGEETDHCLTRCAACVAIDGDSPDGDNLRMTLIVVVAVAVGLGLRPRRWCLLALPPAAALGALLVLGMPGAHVDSDNSLAFLLLLIEVFLAVGILLSRRVPPLPTLSA